MLVTTYFERLYPHTRTEVYHPSQKNAGIFVMLCFCAAGSNHFPFTKGKRYTSADVPLPRKLFDGSRKMTPEIKASFNPFDVDGLSSFYKESIESDKVRDVMLAFGIPPTAQEQIDSLCVALTEQFKAFVDSSMDEADDIVAMEYQKLLAAPQQEKTESYHPASVLYPGDQVYLKSQYNPTYQVNTYEEFQHIWEFENVGTQTWHGRRLYFFNHDAVRPRAGSNYIDIPDTPPHMSVKITVSMEARGFEEKSECVWIMIDSEGNNCFPNSSTFAFVVDAKFDYEK